MAETNDFCEPCSAREGTSSREGLAPMQGIGTLYRAHYSLSLYTCKQCASNWTLVTEIGSGRRPIFIKDALADPGDRENNRGRRPLQDAQ